MKPLWHLLTAGLICALPWSLGAAIERTVEKSFTVTPGGLLRVDTQGGDIQVFPGEGNEVKVIAKEHFRTEQAAEADEITKQLSLQIEQSGADVSAVAKYEGNRMSFLGKAGWPPVQVEFAVTVPAKYRANLHTSGGKIVVGDLTGEVDLRTSGGDIRLGKIDGAVEAQTSGGDITVAEALSRVHAHTSGGDIHVGRVVGEARLSTSGGSVRVDAASSAVEAETSGGDVSARFIGAIAGDSTLKTSGGNVTAQVDAKSAFRLDASTSGGDVRSNGLTIEVERGGNGKSSLVGPCGGGGPVLKLRTSGGDVRVTAN